MSKTLEKILEDELFKTQEFEGLGSLSIKNTSKDTKMQIGIEGNSYQETSEASENILDIRSIFNDETYSTSLNGVIIKLEDDGTLSFNGTATDKVTLSCILKQPVLVDEDTYHLYVKKTGSIQSGVFGIGFYFQTLAWTDLISSTFSTGNDTVVRAGNIKANVKYERFSIDIYADTVLDNVKVYFGVQPKENQEIVPYAPAIPSLDYPSEIKSVGDNINLFNIPFKKGYGLNSSTGAEEVNASCVVTTDYFDVSAYKEIAINVFSDFQLDVTGRIVEYNEAKEFIKCNYNVSQYPRVFIPSPTTKFIKFNIPFTNQNEVTTDVKCMIVATNQTTEVMNYFPYGFGNINFSIGNKNRITKKGTDLPKTFKSPSSGFSSIAFYYDKLFEKKYFETGFTLKVKLKNPLATPFTSVILNSSWATRIGFSFFKKRIENGYEVYEYYYKPSSSLALMGYFILMFEDKTENTGCDLYNFELDLGNTVGESFVDMENEQNISIPVQEKMLDEDYINKEAEYHNYEKIVFTGNENWTKVSEARPIFAYNKSGQYAQQRSKDNVKSNYFPSQENVWVEDLFGCDFGNVWNESAEVRFNLGPSSEINTVEQWKAKVLELANVGTPLIVYIKLRKPKRIECTPEQTKILNKLQRMLSCEDITNIICTDEIECNFKVTAKVSKIKELQEQINAQGGE